MRQADMNDLEEIASIESELFPENNLGEYSLKKELSVSRCWLIEEKGRAVAYLIARNTDGLVDILRVGVLRDFWGRGLATALIERALEEAPEAMLTVRKANVRALRLYLRLGFKVVGEVTSGVSPGWIMRLTSGGRRRCDRSGTP